MPCAKRCGDLVEIGSNLTISQFTKGSFTDWNFDRFAAKVMAQTVGRFRSNTLRQLFVACLASPVLSLRDRKHNASHLRYELRRSW